MNYIEHHNEILQQENLLLSFLQSKKHQTNDAKKLITEIASLIAKREQLRQMSPEQLKQTVELSTVEIPSKL